MARYAFEVIRLLPVVKAYPALSRTYGEVSCVAGVQMGDGGPAGWIRLYPVPFRALEDARRFRKYEPMTVRVARPRSDRRPETRRPDVDSIVPSGHLLPSSNAWRARRAWIEPLMVDSMCELRRRQRKDGTSLGIFRPADITGLVIEPVDVRIARREMAKTLVSPTSDVSCARLS
jgi:hypothetical protein